MVPKRLCIAALVSMAAAACYNPGAAVPPARVTSAQVPAPVHKQPVATKQPAAQKPAAADDEGGPSGVLVVSADIVHRCASLQAIKNGPPPKDEESAWLVILQSLADCMKTGGLKNEHLVVTGGSRPNAVVRYVFAKLGIPSDRVETIETTGPDDEACDLEEDCASFSVRIDVAPNKAQGTQL